MNVCMALGSATRENIKYGWHINQNGGKFVNVNNGKKKNQIG